MMTEQELTTIYNKLKELMEKGFSGMHGDLKAFLEYVLEIE